MTYALLLAGVFAAHTLASISPGPNFLIVTQTAMSGSRAAAVATALGIATGAAVWSAAALLGLTVLFAQIPWLHAGLRLLGGIYLVVLGARLWRAADKPIARNAGDDVAHVAAAQAFRRGLFTNMTNPKAAIFYGSIFAAFLTPDLPRWVALAAVAIIVANSAAWHVMLACLFSHQRAQRWYRRARRTIDRVCGAGLALLGLLLVVAAA